MKYSNHNMTTWEVQRLYDRRHRTLKTRHEMTSSRFCYRQ